MNQAMTARRKRWGRVSAQPCEYLIKLRHGRIVRHGAGLVTGALPALARALAANTGKINLTQIHSAGARHGGFLAETVAPRAVTRRDQEPQATLERFASLGSQ